MSDGSDSPGEVARRAGEAGCRAFALTDHDRLDGLAEAGRAARANGVELVPGCEISCPGPGGSCHVLVYFVEGGGGPLPDALAELQRARDARNVTMAERLAGLGLPVTYEEMVEEAGGTGAGRPHMAAVLVRKGVVSSIQEAFDTWLAAGRPGYVDKERLGTERAIELASSSGGVAVLAHPLSMGLDPAALDSLVSELTGMGLGGLEAIYGRYSPADREGLVDLARRHDVCVTGGSDYHGRYKPDLEVGRGRGDLWVDDSLLELLRDRRPG